jgi:hypothetical protein
MMSKFEVLRHCLKNKSAEHFPKCSGKSCSVISSPPQQDISNEITKNGSRATCMAKGEK